MAAELEEVIVDADLVELEHFAPDLRDQFFNLACAVQRSLDPAAAALHPAAGSALRSILPLGVRGKTF